MSTRQRDYLTGTPNSTPNPTTLGENPVTETIRSMKTRAHRSYATASDTTHEKEFPMYMAMAKIIITPTGFENSKLKYDLLAKVEMMCGEVSHSYTDRTTHLLAAHANTTKVEMARERNLPVMTLEWVETLWNACQQNNPYIHASLPQFQNLECPLFYNLRFTLTNHYDDDTKTYYGKLITDYGGSLTLKVSSPYSSFFVCPPNEKGRMAAMARANKITCIAHAWIVDSIKIGNLMPIMNYEVQENCLPNYLPLEIRMKHTRTTSGDKQGASGTQRPSVPVVNDLIPITDESNSNDDCTLTLSETMIDERNNSTLSLSETLIDFDDDTIIKTGEEEKLSVVSSNCDNALKDLISFNDNDSSIHMNARNNAKTTNENDMLTSVGG